MPTIFSHSIAGIAISSFKKNSFSKLKFYILVIISTCIPDLDVISFKFGISYNDILGHRGITHSIFFALVLSFLITRFFFEFKILSKDFFKLYLIFFLTTISHPILDAFTDGGLGVCLFCPFDNSRFFFGFRPISVSPIGKNFFSLRGIEVLKSEFIWIWIPSFIILSLNWINSFFNKKNS